MEMNYFHMAKAIKNIIDLLENFDLTKKNKEQEDQYKELKGLTFQKLKDLLKIMLKNEHEFFIFMYQIRKLDGNQNYYTLWILSFIEEELDPIFRAIIFEN